MKHLRVVKSEKAALVGWGVRVLMLTDGSDEGAKARLVGLGGSVETQTELYTALAAMIDDPLGYGLFVMDTDVFGGLDAGLHAFKMLRAADVRIPVILREVKGLISSFSRLRWFTGILMVKPFRKTGIVSLWASMVHSSTVVKSWLWPITRCLTCLTPLSFPTALCLMNRSSTRRSKTCCMKRIAQCMKPRRQSVECLSNRADC